MVFATGLLHSSQAGCAFAPQEQFSLATAETVCEVLRRVGEWLCGQSCGMFLGLMTRSFNFLLCTTLGLVKQLCITI